MKGAEGFPGAFFYDRVIMKNLLIVAHIPSANTKAMRDAIHRGAQHPDIDQVEITLRTPFEADASDILSCDGIIMMTTENLGYMSGALKDFFDRTYYPVLEEKQGLPYLLIIRAGHDGTGTRRAVESITTGLRWRAIQEPIICRGEWQDDFLERCEEAGMLAAAGIESGIY